MNRDFRGTSTHHYAADYFSDRRIKHLAATLRDRALYEDRYQMVELACGADFALFLHAPKMWRR